MPIEPTPPVGSARAVGRIDTSTVRLAAGERPRSDAVASPVQLGDLRDPGQAPIDSERVAEIRKAVEHGTYPLVPAKIADAIIAAGMLLRTAE
jgi:negative regulator of flagellin synthesis FlgM